MACPDDYAVIQRKNRFHFQTTNQYLTNCMDCHGVGATRFIHKPLAKWTKFAKAILIVLEKRKVAINLLQLFQAKLTSQT